MAMTDATSDMLTNDTVGQQPTQLLESRTGVVWSGVEISPLSLSVKTFCFLFIILYYDVFLLEFLNV
jgi:hypothetical protein